MGNKYYQFTLATTFGHPQGAHLRCIVWCLGVNKSLGIDFIFGFCQHTNQNTALCVPTYYSEKSVKLVDCLNMLETRWQKTT